MTRQPENYSTHFLTPLLLIIDWFSFPSICKKNSGENLIYPTFKETKDAGLYNLVISGNIFFDQLTQKSLKQS